MPVNWDEVPRALESDKDSADVLIRTAEGQERRAPYDGGWINLADSTHTASNKWAVPADTRSQIEIDGLGGTSETRYARSLDLDVWSESIFRPFAVGDSYSVRITMKLSKAVSSQENIEFDLGIGPTWGIVISDERRALTKGSGVTDLITIGFDIFCLETFGGNGGKFFLTASEAVQVWDKAIFIRKEFTP